MDPESNGVAETLVTDDGTRPPLSEVLGDLSDYVEHATVSDDSVDDTSDSDDPEDSSDGFEQIEENSITSVSFSKGDDTFDIPEDAVVAIPVDGEDVEVSFADLKKAYNASNLAGRRLSDIDKRENAFKAEKQEWENSQKELSEAVEIAMKGDPYGAILKIVMMAGGDEKDPSVLLQNYIKQATATAKKVAKLTPEQLDATIKSKSVEYERQVLDGKKKSFQNVENNKKFNEELSTRLEKMGVDKDFYDMAEKDIKSLEVDLDSMDNEERAEYVIGQIETFYRPYNKFLALAKKEYSDKQVGEIIDNTELMKNILSLAKTADDETLLTFVKMQVKPVKETTDSNSETSETQVDSSKEVAKKAATPERAPQEKEESPNPLNGKVYLDLEDLVLDMEGSA